MTSRCNWLAMALQLAAIGVACISNPAFVEPDGECAAILALDLVETIEDARLQFSRDDQGVATASYFDDSGVLRTAAPGAPRFDHDPNTLVTRGLLLEESRTNVLLQTDFSTHFLACGAEFVVDQAMAPDATLTADRLIDVPACGAPNCDCEGDPNWHGFSGFGFGKAPTKERWTWSVFVRPDTNTEQPLSRVMLSQSNRVTWGHATFDLQRGTVVSKSGSTREAFIQAHADGWFRVSLVFEPEVGDPLSPRIYTAVEDGGYDYVGTGGSLLIWGPQLERGAFPTSFIATAGTPKTRAADVASVYDVRSTEQSTIYAEFSRSHYPSGDEVALELFDEFGTNMVRLRAASRSVFTAEVMAASSSQGTAEFPSSEGHRHRVALAHDSSRWSISADGMGVMGHMLSEPLEQLSVLHLGGSAPGSTPLNGHVSRLTYVPCRDDDAELQAWTIRQ